MSSSKGKRFWSRAFLRKNLLERGSESSLTRSREKLEKTSLRKSWAGERQPAQKAVASSFSIGSSSLRMASARKKGEEDQNCGSPCREEMTSVRSTYLNKKQPVTAEGEDLGGPTTCLG